MGLKNPGYAVELTVAADIKTFTEVSLGIKGLRRADAAVALAGEQKDTVIARHVLDLHQTAIGKTFAATA